jgi:uncharacterized integral membrane protein (TIGR00698 family)
MKKASVSSVLMPAVGMMTLLPSMSSGVSLFLGIAFSFIFGNPYLSVTRKLTHPLLAISVVGLGAGMNLFAIARVGAQGLVYTVFGLLLSLGLGMALGRYFQTEKNTSVLLSVGTAICGGSAIAATAPIIRAQSHQVSLALAIVFILNSIALFLFPWMGHLLNLSEAQFGLWSAIAIHDTSSVVGANLQYGAHALEVGTTVKLARALWIIPLTIGLSGYYSKKRREGENQQPIKRPWFIAGFVIAATVVTMIPDLQEVGHHIEKIARRVLVMTLFLIGSNLNFDNLRGVGIKALLHGVTLWLIVASVSLLAISQNWIH